MIDSSKILRLMLFDAERNGKSCRPRRTHSFFANKKIIITGFRDHERICGRAIEIALGKVFFAVYLKVKKSCFRIFDRNRLAFACSKHVFHLLIVIERARKHNARLAFSKLDTKGLGLAAVLGKCRRRSYR